MDMFSILSASQLESGRQPTEKTPPSPWTDLEVLRGFPQTAQFLAADPDKSAVIFRRFDKVSIRNLLYLEGRVAALGSIQKSLDRDDKEKYWKYDHIAAAAQSWEDFAVVGTEMGHRRTTHDSMKISYGVYEMWNQTLEKRLAVQQRSFTDSNGIKESDQPENAITTDSTEPLSCSEETRRLIQLRWDVALAIQHAVKEYRNSLIVVGIA